MTKIFYFLLVILFAFPIFQILNDGVLSLNFINIINPFIYAAVLAICLFYSGIKEYVLITSLTLLIFMIIFYLSGSMSLAEWTGNLGFGILLITIFTYLPQLIKQGYIERY